MPQGPLLRHQAPLPRHELLRDLQPAPRPPGRPAQDAPRHDHRDGHRHRRGVVRVRRHRVRHRLRRHDRRHRGGRHHRPRRPVAGREVGRRPEDVPRPDLGRLPQPVPDHRPGQPLGAVEHGGVDRAARRVGERLHPLHARRGARRHRAHPAGRGRLGAARQRLRRHHAVPPGQLLVHGRQRARQAAGVPALRRRRRPLPQGLRRGGRPWLPGLRLRRARRPPLPRRRRPSGAARRADRARRRRRARAPAARVDVGRGRPGLLDGDGHAATARARGRARSSTARFRAPAGDLAYRLYRPATPGPHPVVVYFHGGGWVLGSADSDDPLCRDLCVRSGAVIVSVDYRHAPEARFPARHRRRVRGAAVGGRERHRARWHPRPAGGVRLERRGEHRRGRLPAGSRCRRPGDRRPGAAHAGHRQRHEPPVVHRATPTGTS